VPSGEQVLREGRGVLGNAEAAPLPSSGPGALGARALLLLRDVAYRHSFRNIRVCVGQVLVAFGVKILLESPDSRVRRGDVVLPEHAEDLAVMQEILLDQVPEDLPWGRWPALLHSLDWPLPVEVLERKTSGYRLSRGVDLPI
jgi:hypothetical protein